MDIKQSRRSYAKTCIQSCRGARGAAHAKFYLFSKTGKAKNVVMSGSANLTVAGAVNQWNDMYTWVDNRKLFNFASPGLRRDVEGRPGRAAVRGVQHAARTSSASRR